MSLSDREKSSYLLRNLSTSDCGVIALQAVTGWPRDEAEKVALEDAGYNPDRGTPRGGLEEALEMRGWQCDPAPFEVGRDTTATFALRHEYGMYLVYTDDHVMGLVDGNLTNSKGSWHRPVVQVSKVVAPK